MSDALLVNSGSSANLVALTALTSPKLGDRRLEPGDEVVTVAAAFPTTVAPILQNNLVPVFVDVNLADYTANPDQLREAIGPRTRAIMMAHTLGVPFDLDVVADLAKKHDLWVIEDNCDALGSRYRGRLTGTFGHLATMSFYPAHHITMGEGGCVVTNDDQLARIARSFRDWGRDCYCAGGESNTCGTRFSQQFGTLPHGFDHKYVYSHIGYNLKVTDMQAAIGCAQLAEARRLHRPAPRQLRSPHGRPAALRGPAAAAAGDADTRSHPGSDSSSRCARTPASRVRIWSDSSRPIASKPAACLRAICSAIRHSRRSRTGSFATW